MTLTISIVRCSQNGSKSIFESRRLKIAPSRLPPLPGPEDAALAGNFSGISHDSCPHRSYPHLADNARNCGIAVYYEMNMRPLVPDVIATLRRVPLFAELSDQQLGAVAERVSRKRYERDATVFSEGDSCLELLIVEEGSVKLLKSAANGR